MRKILMALAVSLCLAAPAQAAVGDPHVQPPTYNAVNHTVTVVVNLGSFTGYAELWSFDRPTQGPVASATLDGWSNNKATLTATCTPDSTGALHEWMGQGELGLDEVYERVPGAPRYFPCW